VGKEEVSVAVISPYKAQVLRLKKYFGEALGEGARAVDINTIDGFQVREVEEGGGGGDSQVNVDPVAGKWLPGEGVEGTGATV
jgi:hypothetical protein